MEIMIDALIDSLKLLPFLLITYLIMELIEHKTSKKSLELIKKSKKIGPFFGGLLGVVPQCGFSVSASNLYSARIISIGTLLAIFLSNSDEMLPVLISNNISFHFIFKIIIIKVIIGILFGFIIDLFIKKKNNQKESIHNLCEHDHCHCQENIFISVIRHTLKTFIIILIVILLLNTIINLIGTNNISKLLINNTLFGPFIACFIGLIPNCASSVIITELYVIGSITFGSLIGGLLSSSGLGLLILFKTNKNLKENFMIMFLLYFISLLCALLIDIIGITL